MRQNLSILKSFSIRNLRINFFLSHTLFLKGACTMKVKKINDMILNDQSPKDDYDDGNIPLIDLPKDVIPDEVPRKDGPGGE